MKGSKNAVLKLIDSDHFLKSINELIEETGAKITNYDNWMPKSLNMRKEGQLKLFLKYNFSKQLYTDLVKWWLHTNETTPNWDLISTCTIEGERGLLLVEAKAHNSELENATFANSTGTSENSIKNHYKIGEAIQQANTAINKQIDGVCISRDKCYQMSNRVAHTWWLANQGIPVVLLYLGCLKCEDMVNGRRTLFATDEEWQTAFTNHANLVGVNNLVGKKVDCGKSNFIIISKSFESK